MRMVQRSCGIGLIAVLFVVCLPGILMAADKPEAIAEALAKHDRAIHLMDDWMRDPYIVLAPDGWYYLTCTRLSHTAGGEEGIQVWRSRDLAKWEDLGAVWSFSDSAWIDTYKPKKDLGGKGILLWAPELHLLDGKWVGIHTTNAAFANLIVNTGSELKGPFTEPMKDKFGRRHDPSIFTDDDGTHWLVWGCAQIAPLKPDFSGFAGPEVKIGPSNRKLGHEGCLIRKIGDKYVLFGTAWSTDSMRHGTYNLYYCVADKVTGPYGPRQFAGRCLGHGTLFKDKQGRWWCTAFYNAGKPTVSRDEIAGKDVRDSAYTLNKQGLTLVPMEIQVVDGQVKVRAEDPAYAVPGPEEVQKF